MFVGLSKGPDQQVPWPWTQTDNVIKDFDTLAPHFTDLSQIDATSDTQDNKIFTKENKRLHIKILQDWLEEADDWFNNNLQDILSYWPHHRKFNQYKGEVQITRQAPAPYRFPVHDESYDKCWSGVVYCAPNEGTGTGMYTNIQGNSVQKGDTINLSNRWGCAPWKPNRAFVFAGITSKTWHDYESVIGAHRITVNLFIINKKK